MHMSKAECTIMSSVSLYTNEMLIVGAYSTATVQSASVMKAGLSLGFSTTDATSPGHLMKETTNSC